MEISISCYLLDPCERNPCEKRQRCIAKEIENTFECIGT